jgi:hypothetical protein
VGRVEARLLDRLRKSRVRKAGRRNLTDRLLVMHSHDNRGDQVAGVGGDNMASKDLTVGLVGQQLDESFGLVVGFGPGKFCGFFFPKNLEEFQASIRDVCYNIFVQRDLFQG